LDIKCVCLCVAFAWNMFHYNKCLRKFQRGHTHVHTPVLCRSSCNAVVQIFHFHWYLKWLDIFPSDSPIHISWKCIVLPCTCFMCTHVKWCSWLFIRTWTCQKECFSCEYVKVSINIEVFHTVKVVTDKLKLAHAFFFIIKPTRFSNFSNLLRHETLHVSGSFLSIIRSLFTVHSALVYVIQVWRQLSSRTRMECIPCIPSCPQTCMTYTSAEFTVNKLLMMDRGTTRNM
jgi:hypothetical protein